MNRAFHFTLYVILVVATLPLLNGDTCWSQDKVGTSAANFLGIAVGARAAALGGAYSAMADDATSIYWNPGATARLEKSHAVFIHTNWFLDTAYNWAGVVLNFGGANAVGFSFAALDYGEEPVTTIFIPDGTGEVFKSRDTSIGVTYSRNLTDRFSVGGGFKYISQEIFNESARAIAIDLGMLYITELNNIKLGVSFSNLGTEMKMDGKDLLQRVDLDPDATGDNETIVSLLKTESYPLPVIFRVGLAGDLFTIKERNKLRFSVEAMQPGDNNGVVNVGGEIAIHELLFLRAGYKSLFRDESQEGLTMGAGLIWGFSDKTAMVFDYAFADFGLLQNVHMWSLGISF